MIAAEKDTLAALRDACDSVGIAYVKADRKKQLQEKIDEYNAAQIAPGLPGGEPVAEQANGFLVVKVTDGNGNIDVQIQPIGDATMLEAPAVLGGALKQVKAHFGL